MSKQHLSIGRYIDFLLTYYLNKLGQLVLVCGLNLQNRNKLNMPYIEFLALI